jgi:hypothetical protein
MGPAAFSIRSIFVEAGYSRTNEMTFPSTPLAKIAPHLILQSGGISILYLHLFSSLVFTIVGLLCGLAGMVRLETIGMMGLKSWRMGETDKIKSKT